MPFVCVANAASIYITYGISGKFVGSLHNTFLVYGLPRLYIFTSSRIMENRTHCLNVFKNGRLKSKFSFETIFLIVTIK